MDTRRWRRASRRGFTLTEMMVVVVILGLLSTIVVPNVLKHFREAALTAARVDLTALSNALDECAIRNGARFPDTLDALVTPDEEGHTFLKARSVPQDPWKHAYVYEPPSDGEPRPRVVSWGPDGQPGGGDDLDNWSAAAR